MTDHIETGNSPEPLTGGSGSELSLSLLQAGDRQEFARMVDTYSARLYRLTLKMLNNPQDAEDALQETFIKAFRFIGSFDGRSSISTWLYRIATNEALMQLRRKHPDFISIDEPIETEDGEMEPVQIVDWCCVPERELMSDESRRQMAWAVKQLAPGLRAAFLLRDVEGLSTLEAAEVLELSETALKTRLSRARLRLRELLSAYFADRVVDSHAVGVQAEE